METEAALEQYGGSDLVEGGGGEEIIDIALRQAEGDLARRIAHGDTDAWDRFFERYSSWAYRFAYCHLNANSADAEDLCSDIMLAAARSIGQFDARRGELDAWLHGLARHRLARFCRRRRVELPLIADLIDHSSHQDATHSNLAERIQVRDVVNRALASLTERQASALVGKYVEGYTTDELARRIEASPKAVESLLVRARTAFRLAFSTLLELAPAEDGAGSETGGGSRG